MIYSTKQKKNAKKVFQIFSQFDQVHLTPMTASKIGQNSALLKDHKSDTPKDEYNVVYVTCKLLGVATLLPYTFLVSAIDYYYWKYGDKNGSEIVFWMQAVPTIPNAIFLMLSLIYGENILFRSRILWCLSLSGIIMFFPLFTADKLFKLEFEFAFWILLGAASIIAVTLASIQPPIAGFCNYLPIKYVQSSITGQAIAAMIASILRLIVNFVIIDKDLGVIIYFGIGIVIIVITILMFKYAETTKFVKYYLSDYHELLRKQSLTEMDQDLLQTDDAESQTTKSQSKIMKKKKIKRYMLYMLYMLYMIIFDIYNI